MEFDGSLIETCPYHYVQKSNNMCGRDRCLLSRIWTSCFLLQGNDDLLVLFESIDPFSVVRVDIMEDIWEAFCQKPQNQSLSYINVLSKYNYQRPIHIPEKAISTTKRVKTQLEIDESELLAPPLKCSKTEQMFENHVASCPKHELSKVYRIFDVCTDECKILRMRHSFPVKSNEQLVELYHQISNATDRAAVRKKAEDTFLSDFSTDQCYTEVVNFIKSLLAAVESKTTTRRPRASLVKLPEPALDNQEKTPDQPRRIKRISLSNVNKKSTSWDNQNPGVTEQELSNMNQYAMDQVRSRELTEPRSTIVHKINSNYNVPINVVFLGKDIGRGVFAKCAIPRGTFLFEYKGDLIDKKEAETRELLYENQDIGCYMMYFLHKKQMCIDATDEKYGVARLVNHRKEPNNNVFVRKLNINGSPKLCMFSCCAIRAGEELRHDYGDRSRKTIDMNPWLEE